MMMYLPLFLGALLCLAALAARYFTEAGRRKHKQPPKTWRKRVRLAKLLVGAAMALYAISTTLNHMGDKMVP
ncbi:MAG: hypothetical protein ABI972_09045 [Acidobacteriota bacterium]